jgi:hypothetical protein
LIYYPGISLEGLLKTAKNLGIAGVPAEILTLTGPGRYRYANPLSPVLSNADAARISG